ncbi:Polyphosphate kinase [Rhodomicrobium vannielii ATCC 17100]|uniref:Polyphosphate kinase n=1 Tax=Rhodomicrobium vannielii (strain ATCC 17100 / DSM 162 / LMG 4299 / NCIMB 10020 / ATH 3.1.1) TaxID=648757 RepID=E3I6D0_RHOVT|nr:RNA degradosome polyphosphate kinase [Rhodomicrobium vannielii]ADP69491.1 Polyphosphate kinase [Rhodomicrobium vannielii ATCC 17100]
MKTAEAEPAPTYRDRIEAFGDERFFNRELSWLAFNRRVLEESANTRNPLLERVRFLAISGSNLDEFYRVRVAGLHEQAATEIVEVSPDGLTPRQQVEKINEAVMPLSAIQQERWNALREDMAKEQIYMASAKSLSDAERDWLEIYFMRRVFSALSAVAVDAAHPFPHVQSQELVLVLECTRELALVGDSDFEGEPRLMYALVVIPNGLDRFIRLPQTVGENGKPAIRFIAMEVLIALHAHTLLPGFKVKHAGLFRPLRNSGIEFQEKSEDLQKVLRKALVRRQLGEVIRLEMSESLPVAARELIIAGLKIDRADVVPVDGLFAIADISQLVVSDRPDLVYKPFEIRFPERIAEFENDCFAAISSKDIVVHHPYESFDVVLQYLRQAASDPDVVAIKWTLYRTSKRSPIVEALRQAREAGKSVTVMIEVTARFDELNNLEWAKQLEAVGVHVVYGLTQLDLKTHAKLGQVVRKENGELRTYCHIGTGNYHPATAKIYTDLSYFTADAAVGRDVSRIFNYVTTYSRPNNLERMYISPHGIKARIIEEIHNEIAHAKAGRPAAIWMKLNALVDPEVIDALYEASLSGVPVDLVIRGICCLKPGIHGLSENIRAKSIIGRFLEHSRIYCFGAGHGLPSEDAHVYISSADMMPRNLERRVEAMTAITNPTVHEQVLDQIMIANLKDNLQSWKIESDGSSQRFHLKPGEEPFSAHEYFMTNPSLSGRGGALKQNFPRRFAVASAPHA